MGLNKCNWVCKSVALILWRFNSWVKDNIQDWRDVIIVSPDAGGAKRFVFFLTLALS